MQFFFTRYGTYLIGTQNDERRSSFWKFGPSTSFVLDAQIFENTHPKKAIKFLKNHQRRQNGPAEMK